MRLLLDTNVLLWQIGLSGGGRLGSKARSLMQQAEAVCVSAISIVEMQIKTMNGKLDAPADVLPAIIEAGDQPLDFSPGAADGLRNFPKLARYDPFDRMLLAQAQTEGLHLLTADELLLGLKLPFIVDARQ